MPWPLGCWPNGVVSRGGGHARRRIKAARDRELAAEKQDAAQLASLRRRVQKALAGQLPLKADHE